MTLICIQLLALLRKEKLFQESLEHSDVNSTFLVKFTLRTKDLQKQNNPTQSICTNHTRWW